MSEYHLDHHLRQADAAAIADGEAERQSYCWAGQHFVPWEEMPPLPAMTCYECEKLLEEEKRPKVIAEVRGG